MRVLGAHPSVNTHTDWITSQAALTKEVKAIKPTGGVDFDFDIQDQLQFPICTGFGSYIQEYWQYKETGKRIKLSPMFVYRINKIHDGLPPNTEGSTGKATMDTLRIFGVCRDILWPINQKNYTTNPEGQAMQEAPTNRIEAYTRNPGLDEMLISLDAGKPVGFSMFLLSNFFKTVNGRVPKEVTGTFVGGHFMVACRYDLEQEIITVPQSWGLGAPTKNGYMEIPFTWFRFLVKQSVGAGQDYLFPLLMDSYTPLDFVPDKQLVLPKTITVGDRIPTIEVNGQTIPVSDRVFAFISKELSRTLVSIRTIEEVMKVLTGQEVQVVFDEVNYIVKINI